MLMAGLLTVRADGPLTHAGNHSDAISPAGDEDTWTFTAQEGDRIYLRASQTSGGTTFAPRLRVFDAGQNLVGRAAGASDSSTSSARLDHVATSTGTFTVIVDSALANGTGNYRMDFVRQPGDAAVPSGETGGPLPNESRSEGAIAIGDLDVWSFEAATGNSVLLRLAQLSGGTGFVPRMRVFGADGGLLAEAAGGSNSSTSEARLLFQPTAEGTFMLAIDSATAEGTGNYRIHRLQLPGAVTTPSGDTGGPLTSGGNHDGAISLGDMDAWTFEAAAGERVFLRAAQTSGDATFAPRLQVYDARGLLVGHAAGASNSNASEARLDFVPDEEGSFTVVLDSSLVEGTGNYRLFYLKSPGSFITPPLDDGMPLVTGNQDGSTTLGDLDVWTFTANAGDRVTLGLTQLTGAATYAPRARVYDGNGTLVGYSVDTVPGSASASTLKLILPTTGTFNVVLDSLLIGGSGNYRINYLLEAGPFSPEPANGTTLTNGGNHEGAIAVGEEDPWIFEVSAGEQVFLRLAGLTGGSGNSAIPTLRLGVYGPEGELVASTSAHNDASISFVTGVAGSYTALVSFGTGLTGTYRLHYLKLPSAFTIPGGDEGGPLANGGNHEGAVTLADLDPWTFEVSAGEQVFLRLAGLTGGSGNSAIPTLRLGVYGPEGELVASTSAHNDASISFVTGVAGSYTALVSFGTGLTGTYRLHYLKLPSAFTIPGGDEGGPLANGGNHEGAVTLADLDPWTFEVSAGEQVLLRLAALTGGSGNSAIPTLRLGVYGPDGELVASTSAHNDASISFVTGVAGSYTALVSFGTGLIGTYRLHYLKIPGAFIIPGGDEGGPLTNGGNHEGAVTLADLDPWTFEADQGNNITLQVQEVTTTSLTPLLLLYGPDGQFIGSHTHASLAQLNFTAPDSGIFLVVVANNTAGGTGNYQISATGLPEQGKQLRVAWQRDALQNETVTVNWPSALTGHVLQWSEVVDDPDGWEDIGAVNDNGLNVRITIPVEPGQRFFRLRPPTP
ncbi:MAG: hypothetical protein KF833_04565 [Verrucomicrobiae bacterium]|nr:hypothetical protein [Verrucomicrobiae bacterium]